MCLAFPCNDTPACPSSTAPCRLDRQGRKIDRLRGESTDLRSAAADLSSEPAKRQAPKKGRVACILPATTSACGGCGGPGCTGATRFSLSICCSGGTSPSGALSKTERAISDHAKHIRRSAFRNFQALTAVPDTRRVFFLLDPRAATIIDHHAREERHRGRSLFRKEASCRR